MKHRLAVLATATAALASPAVAQAATLTDITNKPCYGTGDGVGLAGSGFSPNGEVTISRDGRALNGGPTANAQGNFAGTATVPVISSRVLTSTYTATDRTNPSITASTRARLSSLRVTVRPTRGNPRRPRRIAARGFTAGGRTLYAHVVRGRSKRNLRIGRLTGACRTITRRRRIFGPNVRLGVYRVQFDTFRRFKKSRRQRIFFNVTIRRVVRSSTASAATVTESWQRVR